MNNPHALGCVYQLSRSVARARHQPPDRQQPASRCFLVGVVHAFAQGAQNEAEVVAETPFDERVEFKHRVVQESGA